MSTRTIKTSVDSPWLTPQEAADYCKVSLSFFNQKRRTLPIKFGGTRRRPRFHREELDLWMEKGFTIEQKIHRQIPDNDKYAHQKKHGLKATLVV